MSSFWQKFEKPIIALAPMAGIGDSAFRQICKNEGADLVYSEMVSSYGIIYNDKKTFSLCRFKNTERPIIIQIFGRDPKIMAEAAVIVENKFKPEGIDINFGCPARRVIKSGHGAVLMDEPELAEKIVRHISKKVKIPLSVKTRLGARKKDEIFDFAKRMEAAGVQAMAIHGRTLKQGFKGEADWQPIYKTKELVKIPVLGNGDIKNYGEIKEKLKNLAGVLIGRGALGNPFIFNYKKKPNFEEIKKVILKHAYLAEEEKGERGLIELRKHLGWYVKGWPEARSLRQRLVKVETIGEIKKILNIKYQISNKMINY